MRARYGVSDMTLWRWLKNEELAFPHPIRINNRRFWRLNDLEAGEAVRLGVPMLAPHSATTQTPPGGNLGGAR